MPVDVSGKISRQASRTAEATEVTSRATPSLRPRVAYTCPRRVSSSNRARLRSAPPTAMSLTPIIAATATTSDAIPDDAGAVVSHSATKIATTAPAAARANGQGSRDSGAIVRAGPVLGRVGVQPDQDGRERERRDQREVGKLTGGRPQPDRGNHREPDGAQHRCRVAEPLPAVGAGEAAGCRRPQPARP